MVRFPEALPSPLLSGKKARKIDGVERTQMQSGRTFSRLVFDDTPTDITLSWYLTQAEAFLFEQWHREAIKSGALEFIMPITMSDGLRDRVVKFMDMYDGPNKIAPRIWQISAPVQMRDQVGEGIDPGWWEFPQWIEYASLFDITMNRNWPEA